MARSSCPSSPRHLPAHADRARCGWSPGSPEGLGSPALCGSWHACAGAVGEPEGVCGAGSAVPSERGWETRSSSTRPGPCPVLRSRVTTMCPACGGRIWTPLRTRICPRCTITCPSSGECVPSSGMRAAGLAWTTRGWWPPVDRYARPSSWTRVDGMSEPRGVCPRSAPTRSSWSPMGTWREQLHCLRHARRFPLHAPRSRLCALESDGAPACGSVPPGPSCAPPLAPGGNCAASCAPSILFPPRVQAGLLHQRVGY